MESNNNSKVAAIVGVIVVVLLGVGIWAWSMNNEDDTTTDNTTDSAQAPADDAAAQQDIVALASETSDLSTLVTAVQAADLVETLQGDGPFTVFAPTNAAFDKLPDGTLDDLLLPENQDQLVDVLTYHVVSGKVMSSDLSDGQVVDTLQGGQLTVEITDGMVYLVDAGGNKAQVTTPDVEASNGVVHIIDTVVLP